MTLQTLLLAALIIILGSAQYALMAHAIRDLLRRPRVRGGNKVVWGFLVLCLPIAGALLYSWMGPTSFLRRPMSSPAPVIAPTGASPSQPRPMPLHGNVTPITPLHATTRRRAMPPRPRGSSSGNATITRARIRRTGS